MDGKQKMPKCNKRTEVFSRVVGFHRPVQMWNPGKKEEFGDRKNFVVKSENHKNAEKDLKKDNFCDTI
jgi:ribonucleoside-triphosphate reductase